MKRPTRNMRPHIFVFALITLFCTLPAVALETKHHALITPIIEAFASNDIDAISKHVRFPYHSTYPISPITEDQFAQRFDEIFDAELIQNIAQSDIRSDWSEVGWRGIMLNRGLVWVDYDGKISGINYTTETAKQVRDALISADKATLPKELREFESPILKWTTARSYVRIDALTDGSYRYSQWKNPAVKTEAPDLILKDQECHSDGNGGNHYYEFNQGDTTIQCYVIRLGKDDTPGTITTYQNGIEIEQAIVLSSK